MPCSRCAGLSGQNILLAFLRRRYSLAREHKKEAPSLAEVYAISDLCTRVERCCAAKAPEFWEKRARVRF